MDALRKTLLAEGGRDGFDSYRVPGLAVTAAGTLLACCEGRIKEGDRRTLLLYRSTDDGATFAPRTVLAEPAPGQLLHNPCCWPAGTAGCCCSGAAITAICICG